MMDCSTHEPDAMASAFDFLHSNCFFDTACCSIITDYFKTDVDNGPRVSSSTLHTAYLIVIKVELSDCKRIQVV